MRQPIQKTTLMQHLGQKLGQILGPVAANTRQTLLNTGFIRTLLLCLTAIFTQPIIHASCRIFYSILSESDNRAVAPSEPVQTALPALMTARARRRKIVRYDEA